MTNHHPMLDVRTIAAADAHPLRLAVLRKGVDSTDVHFAEDEHGDAFHLGAFAGDELVGVASFSPAPTPFRPGAESWQLRGMAVADDRQGRGIGAALIAAAVRRLREDGAAVLWCNARDSAQAFYAKLGFVVEGDGFVTRTTGLPHHVMVRDL